MCDAAFFKLPTYRLTGLMIMWFVMSGDDAHLMNGLWHSQSNTINQLSLMVYANAVNGMIRADIFVSKVSCVEDNTRRFDTTNREGVVDKVHANSVMRRQISD